MEVSNETEHLPTATTPTAPRHHPNPQGRHYPPKTPGALTNCAGPNMHPR